MVEILLAALLVASLASWYAGYRNSYRFYKVAKANYEWLKFLISAEEYHLSQRLLDETITEDQRTAARLFLHRIQKMQDEVGNA